MKKYLDIGCGIKSTDLIYERIKNAKIVGVDINQEAVNEMKQRFPNHTFTTADAHNLPFRKNSFDRVYCLHTLEHVNDPLKVINEIYRVLRPKGMAYISVPHENYEKVIGKILPNYHGPNGHLRIFTGIHLMQLAESANLKNLSVKTQKWFHAITLTGCTIISKYFGWPMSSSYGRIIPIKTESDNKNDAIKPWHLALSTFRKTSELLDRIPVLSSVNKIYPLEIHITAEKDG
ncbi:MAG: class I SAM-dependent methyltransferase [Candidatus Woesebacteria bacterium]|jgi:SAM-dependent methyltransferase